MTLAATLPTYSPRAANTLRDALSEGQRLARQRGRKVLVSVVEPLPLTDPLAVFAAAPTGMARAFWHDQPAAQAIAGVGEAAVIEATGDGRFQAVAAAWRGILEGALVTGAAAWGTGPMLLGGFSFDPQGPRGAQWADFPDARFALPRYAVAASADDAWMTTNLLLAPDGDTEAIAQEILRERAELLYGAAHNRPDPAMPQAAPRLEDALPRDRWEAMVARTAGQIRQGDFAKVVLARQARAAAPGAPFDAARTLARLRVSYPTAYLFAFAHGPRAFVGATPERLLSLHNRVVETGSLAGSIRRGATPEEDATLGQTLLASAKDLTEHAVVAAMLREALAPVCREVEMPDAPVLLRLSNVQHLYTPIRGALSNGQTALDLVERLHPTPAVGGFPRQAAMAAIREREQLDRGWYAGPVGWLDARAEGQFAVAIRSALLESDRREAALFAGCGIVADSEPEAEYAESRLKMQAMLSALA